MIARRPHDGAADIRAAGEDKMIEGQRRKCRADLGAAGNDATCSSAKTSRSMAAIRSVVFGVNSEV